MPYGVESVCMRQLTSIVDLGGLAHPNIFGL